MAVTTTLKKVSVALKVNNGLDAHGSIKTASINLGPLSTANFDAGKAMAIVNLIQPCLENTRHSVEKIEVSTLTEA